MRRKILISLSICSLAVFLTGVYIISGIEQATSKLDQLITLHQVEILREHLLIHIKRVQSNLYLKNTRHAKGFSTMVSDVQNMGKIADTCFDCHHSANVQEKLTDLSAHIEKYKEALSRISTIRANVARLEEEEDNAFKAGEELIAKVNNMITLTSIRLEEKTQAALVKIGKTKTVLFILIVAGPIIATVLTLVFFIRDFSKPVGKLLNATRKLKEGDLDFRLEGLRDEFGEFATSFNDMAVSLKEHMKTIQESEERYRVLFESAGDAIFILDAEGENVGRIVAANKAAADMHGYTVDELKTYKIMDIDTPETARQAPERVKRIMNGEWIKAEAAHLRKDGTVFPVEISAGLFELSDRKYILAIDRDITERKQSEEILQRTGQMRMFGELAAGLAHEIKNPLAGIKASMEVLSEEVDMPENDKTVLLQVIEEIRRIELLIKDLLSFARPPKPKYMTVDINEVLDSAIVFSMSNSLFSSNRPNPVKIIKDKDGRLPLTMADPMQIKQVFLNILLNAVDAMPEGGDLAIKTFFDEQKNNIRITVADTGNGIEEKFIDKIFEPFFTTKSKGTGLGLAISKRLVEQIGGNIIAENNPDRGAKFSITIPVKPIE